VWIINFGHPLTEEQKQSIERITQASIEQIIAITPQFDNSLSYAEQCVELIDRVGLTPEQWQGLRLLVVPPSFAPIASCVIAELHGRMGYFPPIVRLRPIANCVPPQFEVAEIINLQAIREEARSRRIGGQHDVKDNR